VRSDRLAGKDIAPLAVNTNLPLYVGHDALPNLVRYCDDQHLTRFTLVADQNTYPVLGKAVEEALKTHGFDLRTIVLQGREIIADEYYLMQVLLRASNEERVYLAVGSGTITDITRFVSHRTRTSFISIPTAPSVDGFTSPGAPLVVARLKQTFPAQPPAAVFADLATLIAAPRQLVAAGFGDILGKYTSLADWRLGQLLWDEPYSDTVAQRTRKALQTCVDHAQGIGEASKEGILSLMNALLDSGICMLEFGNSRPAAGAEHHLSHYLEMQLLRENRPAILHGAKVGVSCILMAKYFDRVKQLTRQQVAARLQAATLPDRAQEVQRIKTAYGSVAEQIFVEHAPFLDISEQAYDRLKQKILNRWADILDIASTVPTPQELVALARRAGGPFNAEMIGLREDEVAHGLDFSHYLRNRFTILKLSRILGIERDYANAA
jgi:glycerol-1-phosphate dehydrogenase [NAD(P)+]